MQYGESTKTNEGLAGRGEKDVSFLLSPTLKKLTRGAQVALAIKNLHGGSFDRNGLSQQAHKERKKKGIAKSLISK